MSNTFGLTRELGDKEYFRLSNAASDEMIHALVAAGSALAETEREKQLIVWLGVQHTDICGMGNVGFDIVEMPWTKDGFESFGGTGSGIRLMKSLLYRGWKASGNLLKR